MKLATLCFVLALPMALSMTARADEAAEGKQWVYIGTYTGKDSKGIYLCELDLATGKLTEKGVAAETPNPSFLAIHPNRRFLYSVSEAPGPDDKPGGGVSAFKIDASSGKLTELNRQSSGGSGPCHIALDPKGKVVVVANYGGGSVASIGVAEDGSLKKGGSFIQHKGSSVDPGRQKEPHAHSINVDASGKFAAAADLGLDKVIVYKLDTEKGTMSEGSAASVKPGSGPRHFAFHPSGKYAYVINEMLCTVTAFTYDGEKGELAEIHTLSSLPEPVKGNSTAEVQVHPSGKFLYGSNRGHNSIAIFSIDQDTGKLKVVGHESTQGKTPRNFGIDPTGTYLLAANQDSNSVVVFKIDQKTGELKATGSSVKVASPVCVKFLPIGGK